MDKKLVASLFLIGIVVIVIVAIVYYSNASTPGKPSILYIDLVTSYGKSGTSPTLNVSIKNTGGEATGVSVNLSSDVFDKVSTNSVDVPANQTVYAHCNPQIKDVANGEYKVTISCDYKGGNVTTSNSSQFYVLPSIEITDVHFVMVGGFLGIGAHEDDTIGQNKNTTLIFEIKSDSTISTYTNLSASATYPQGSQGLVITNPTLDSIGPKGTSREYSFAISTHNTPVGKYIITIQVFSGQYEVVSDNSRTLTVS